MYLSPINMEEMLQNVPCQSTYQPKEVADYSLQISLTVECLLKGQALIIAAPKNLYSSPKA
jgi:hypothetical protein